MSGSGIWLRLLVSLLLLTACQAPGTGAFLAPGAEHRPESASIVTSERFSDAAWGTPRARASTPPARRVIPPRPEQAPPAPRVVPPATIQPAAPRIVAIGDLHGDLRATREVLRLADIIDEDDHWIAGDLVVVQLGDQLDRGDDEREILDLFEVLADEAHAAGGAFYSLLGNHETMNVGMDFRYVTEGGWTDFQDIPHDASDPVLASFAPEKRGRVAAFRPGGRYARILAQHNAVMMIGDTVFVHGGISTDYLGEGLAAINRKVQAWLRGDGPRPSMIDASDGPVWHRRYSSRTDGDACRELEATLARLGARRMVVGHTPQIHGVNSACDGRVWRVDVGMAAHYGGTAAAIELAGEQVAVLNHTTHDRRCTRVAHRHSSQQGAQNANTPPQRCASAGPTHRPHAARQGVH